MDAALSRKATNIVKNIQKEMEDLMDLFEESGVEYHEMDNQERDSRRTARSERKTAGRNIDGPPDRRLKENREGSTGQGEVRDPANDRRLKENR